MAEKWRACIHTPEGVMRIVRALRERGFEAYVVGGAVRNYLLGREPRDWDIATSARPGDVKEVASEEGWVTLDVGVEYGVVPVVLWGDVFEVATFRREHYIHDRAGKPVVRFADDPEEDALRRDFTINALYFDPLKGEVLDFVGGIRDIRRRLLRFIGDAEERIREDPNRMLRAVRLASCLSLKLHREAHRAIRRLWWLMSLVAWERIQVELLKGVSCGGWVRFLRLLHSTRLHLEVIPEMELWSREYWGLLEEGEKTPRTVYGRLTLVYLPSVALFGVEGVRRDLIEKRMVRSLRETVLGASSFILKHWGTLKKAGLMGGGALPALISVVAFGNQRKLSALSESLGVLLKHPELPEETKMLVEAPLIGGREIVGAGMRDREVGRVKRLLHYLQLLETWKIKRKKGKLEEEEKAVIAESLRGILKALKPVPPYY